MQNTVMSNLFLIVGVSTKYKTPLFKNKRKKNEWGVSWVVFLQSVLSSAYGHSKKLL